MQRSSATKMLNFAQFEHNTESAGVILGLPALFLNYEQN
jgi:hypothetical protein